MKKCRKAINFDLSIKNLKLFFNDSNPNYAYTLIKKYMLEHGFGKRQYSGYISDNEMTDNELISFVVKMSKVYPWLHKSVLKCDSTDISNIHDLIEYLNLPYNANDEEQILFLCDSSNEYKLYLNQEGTYTLFDEDEIEVGITECDNIEEALNEIEQKNEELEL